MQRLFRWLSPTPKDVVPLTQPDVSVAPMERRHLDDVPYMLPKDVAEEQRIMFQHHLLEKLVGLHNTPISNNIQTILDVGTGSGHWAYAMARKFPQAQVFGVDLEMPQITGNLQPTNYQFMRGDILSGLPFQANSFDLVYQRLLIAAMPTTHWGALFQEEVRVARPGGWVEILEGSNVYPNAGHATKTFVEWGKVACEKRQIYPSAILGLDKNLKYAGLKDVVSKTIDSPLGAWGGSDGENMAKNMLNAFKALKDVYTREAGVNPQEFRIYIEVASY